MVIWERIFLGGGLVMIELLLQTLFRSRNWGVENLGVSWGILTGGGAWVLGMEFLVLLVIVVWQRKRAWLRVGWWLMLVGGGANFVSRVLFGSVWDYLPVWRLWINGADIMVSMGLLVLIFKRDEAD